MVLEYKHGQKVEYTIFNKPQFPHLPYEYQNCDGGIFSSAGCSGPLLNFIHIMRFLLEKVLILLLEDPLDVPSIRSVSHSLRIFLSSMFQLAQGMSKFLPKYSMG